jgi:hypothetical protein
MHGFTKTTLVVSLLIALLVPATAGKRQQNGSQPILCTVSAQTVHPGDNLSFTVYLDQETDGDLLVAVTPASSTQFSQLPTSVIVPDGDDHVVFQGHVATTATGPFTITVSANGGRASTPATIID